MVTFRARSMLNGSPSPQSRSKGLVEHLKASQIWRDYAKAFAEATGLPLGLLAGSRCRVR